MARERFTIDVRWQVDLLNGDLVLSTDLPGVPPRELARYAVPPGLTADKLADLYATAKDTAPPVHPLDDGPPIIPKRASDARAEAYRLSERED